MKEETKALSRSHIIEESQVKRPLSRRVTELPESRRVHSWRQPRSLHSSARSSKHSRIIKMRIIKVNRANID